MNVKTLCLGALSLGDQSGYDIKKLFEGALSHFHYATYGSIYPALRQLEREGLIDIRTAHRGGRPAPKMCHLTAAGHKALRQALTAASPTEQLRSEFLVLTYFSHLLSDERLAEILVEERERHSSTLAYLESIVDLPEHRPGTRFTVHAAIARHRAMLAFLDEQGPTLCQSRRSLDPEHEGTLPPLASNSPLVAR